MSSHLDRPINPVLKRAYTVAALLCAGTVALTGVFITRISNAYAAAHRPAVSSDTGETSGGAGGTLGGQPNQLPAGSGGQVSVPQQNQAPVGRSNGS